MRSATGLDKDNIVNVGGVDFITTPPTQQQLKAKRLLKELVPEDNLGKQTQFALGPGGLKVPMRVMRPWPEYKDPWNSEGTEQDKINYMESQASLYVSRRKKAGLPLLDYTVGKQGFQPKGVPNRYTFSSESAKDDYMWHIKKAQKERKYNEFSEKRYGWADEYRTSPFDFDPLNPKYKLLYDKQHEHDVREIEEGQNGGLSPYLKPEKRRSIEALRKFNKPWQSFKYGQNRAPLV